MNLSHVMDDDLELRLWEPRHTAEVYAAIEANREHIGRWMPWCTPAYAVSDAKRFIEQNLKSLADGRGVTFGIYERGKLVGGVGNNGANLADRSCDIGYWLIESAQGRVIMTRAARAMTDCALLEMKFNRCTIHAAAANTRSWAVPERLGYEHVAVFRKAVQLHGEFVDHVQYAMLAEEWRTRKGDD